MKLNEETVNNLLTVDDLKEKLESLEEILKEEDKSKIFSLEMIELIEKSWNSFFQEVEKINSLLEESRSSNTYQILESIINLKPTKKASKQEGFML